MSTPFTPPARQMWQTLLSELTTAYSERRQAIGQLAYVPEYRIVQSAAYWAGLQAWLESNCTTFIDHVSGPLSDDSTKFLYFTLDKWRTAAGINQNGFRRSPLSGGTAYGHMQVGDAIGPWIFEDLQKGFGALIWTTKPCSDTKSFLRSRGFGDSSYCCLDMRTLALTEWMSLSWVDLPEFYDSNMIYYCHGEMMPLFGGYAYYIARSKGTTTVSAIPVHVPCDVFFYGKAKKIRTINVFGWDIVVGFRNEDGLELKEDEMYLFDFALHNQQTSVTSKTIGDYETNPLDTLDVQCPLSIPTGGDAGLIAESAIIKWHVTNA